MERIYPTADFKDGLVKTYPKHIDDMYYLFYDQEFTKPVMDADIPSIFVNGAINLEGFMRPHSFIPNGMSPELSHNAIMMSYGSSLTILIAGEFAPEEDSEDDGDNSSDEPAGQ